MTTITLNLPLPPDSSTVTTSPSPQALVTSTTSHPHLVTVIDPETTAKDLTKSSGHDEVVTSAENGVEGADESSAATLSGGVDPSLSGQSIQNGPTSTAACVQTGNTEEMTEQGKIDHQDQQEQSSDITTVTALLVFGGMDTNGHIHSDCFIIVPPQELKM